MCISPQLNSSFVHCKDFKLVFMIFLNHCTMKEVLLLIFFLKNFLFIYLLLCWVFVAVHGLSPVAGSGGSSSCVG